MIPAPAPAPGPAPEPSSPRASPPTSLFANQEGSDSDHDSFAPTFSWSAESSLLAAAAPPTSDSFPYHLGDYIQDQQGLGVYDSYSTYGSDLLSTFSTGSTTEALFPSTFSSEFTYDPALLVPVMDPSANIIWGGLDVVMPTAEEAPPEFGYFDEGLFDWALRNAVTEVDSAVSGVVVGQEAPTFAEVPAFAPAPTSLPTPDEITPSPAAHAVSVTTHARAPHEERGTKRKLFWGVEEEDEEWLVAVQRKLVRKARQRREFREMREAKVRQMADIVGGEIVALLDEARRKAQEHVRLVVEQRNLVEEQRSLVEEQRRLMEELRGIVEEKRRTAGASMVWPFPTVVSPVPPRASENTA